MDHTASDAFTIGTEVVGADGEKVGKIVAVHPNYVVVEKGFFFPTDYYVPTSAIAREEGDRVVLSMDRDEALAQNWDEVPTDIAAGEDDAYSVGAASATSGTVADRADLQERSAPFEHFEDTAATHIDAEQRIRVPVREEELEASTHPVQLGEVRVEKEVVAEERVLEVPVIEERLRVERRAVDRDASGDADLFTEGAIEIPIGGEQVDLATRVHVVEEVEIEKQAVRRTEEVAGTVRREEVRVEDDVAVSGSTLIADDTGAPGFVDETIDRSRSTSKSGNRKPRGQR
jgi:uncharacterized protein (TIGR02271 family)